jgi:hypothetical protein
MIFSVFRQANMIQTEEGWFCDDNEYLAFRLLAQRQRGPL